jgi:dipeptidyl aminopeptidase/acylaminoacyl peptidase
MSRLTLGLALATTWLSALSPASFAADAPGKWTPAETLKYRLVSDVQVSPDGKRAAYVVREAAYTADKSEWRTQVWLSSTDGKDARQATHAETSSSRPRWSPDGNTIAFLGKRGEPNVNVWLLPLRGGEAQRLTSSKSDVADFAWSPDGKWIAFVAPEPVTEERQKREKEKDDATVVDEEDRPGRLWVVTVEPDSEGRREARRLLASKFSIGAVPESGGTNALDWSPDGKTIAIVHTARPAVNEWPSADISLVDLATGSVKPLAATGAAETSPHFSPDGRWIVYVATDDPPRWAHRQVLRLVPAAGGPVRDLPHSFDEAPELAGWSADSQTIYFSEARHVSDVLYAQDVKTGAIRALTEEGKVSNGANVNAKGSWIGFVRQTPTDPTEAWASPLSPFSPVKISDVNASLPKHPLGETRTISWTSPDGKPIEGLLTLPPGYEPGKKYPLLLVIHGGPAGVFKLAHIATPGAYPAAALAAEGYAVLRANPRGSSGYGTAFRQANIKDWGGGDYADLMAGVDKVVAMGIADPDRLGVMGWSYGGFMTAWIITQTNRFKAASIGAPVTELISFTGTSDIPGFIPDYFGGEFWDEGIAEVYRSHSAMGHIANARTPALIQHGESDVRVPISQGYQLYNALKRRGVPVRMVTYPRQPHGIREPRLIQDLGERNIAWMAEWVLKTPPSP